MITLCSMFEHVICQIPDDMKPIESAVEDCLEDIFSYVIVFDKNHIIINGLHVKIAYGTPRNENIPKFDYPSDGLLFVLGEKE